MEGDDGEQVNIGGEQNGIVKIRCAREIFLKKRIVVDDPIKIKLFACSEYTFT